MNIREVDDQHRQLFKLMNEVYQVFRHEGISGRLRSTLDQLVALARKHLADEEVLMEKAGYSRLSDHKQVHRKLLDDMDRHLRAFESEKSVDSVVNLLMFLKSWLVDHIYEVDKRYVEELHAAGIR